MSYTGTQQDGTRFTVLRSMEIHRDIPKRGGDAIGVRGSSEQCENDEHDWADVGMLDKDDHLTNEEVKVWDKTLILQVCRDCGKKRVLEEGEEEEDISSELGGTMLAYVEDHPDLQRW